MKPTVRIVYRSRGISIPLITAMEASGSWEKAGLDVQRLDYVSGAGKSDPMLFDGEVDFIFGSHISPYIHRANGKPIVYLGQSINWTDDYLVTRKPVNDLTELRGAGIAEKKTLRESHPWGNHKLYLNRGGVDLTEVDWVGTDQDAKGRSPIDLVAEGAADAAFVSPPNHLEAEEIGLVVQQLPFLPMVQATTLTTLWDTRVQRPDVCRGVIRAVRDGISFYKNEPEQMIELMEKVVGPKLGVESEKALRGLYARNCRLLEDQLYPQPAAVQNAFRIAVFRDPSIQEKVNPLELWDVDLLRQEDADA